jgi:hypothetical protein
MQFSQKKKVGFLSVLESHLEPYTELCRYVCFNLEQSSVFVMTLTFLLAHIKSYCQVLVAHVCNPSYLGG